MLENIANMRFFARLRPYHGSGNPEPKGIAGVREIYASNSSSKVDYRESEERAFIAEQSAKLSKEYYPGNNGGLKQEYSNNASDIRDNKHQEITDIAAARKVKIEELSDNTSRPPVNNNNLQSQVPQQIASQRNAVSSSKNGGADIAKEVKDKLD